ncbi:MAG: YgeY family selenium metabolism-linked hydrolase [Anaerolineae bacterium]
MEIPPPDKAPLLSFLQDIIRIPSPSTKERRVVERVAEEMKRVGFAEVSIDEVGNVVGRIGPRGGKRLLYDAHTDTVGVGDPSAWSRDPYGAEIEEGLLYGRGAVDNKGALAAMIYGAKSLIEAGLDLAGDLYVVGTVQEEDCEGYAIGLLCRKLKPHAVLLGEPSDLQISRGQRGRLMLIATTHGRSCHASTPELGLNAIYAMNRVVAGVEALNSKLAQHPFLGPGSIAVTRIEGAGASLNVVPDTCRAYLDRRLTWGEDEELALAQVREIIQEEGVEARVETMVYEARSYTGYPCRQKKYFPAWLLEEGHPLVQMGARTVKKALGYEPQIIGWRFSTDGVATKGELGIPTIGFGPGEEAQAHSPDEQIPVADVVKAARVYAQLALDFLGR